MKKFTVLFVSVALASSILVPAGCQSLRIAKTSDGFDITVKGDDGVIITGKGYEDFLKKAGDHKAALDLAAAAAAAAGDTAAANQIAGFSKDWDEIIKTTLQKKDNIILHTSVDSASVNSTPVGPVTGGSSTTTQQ